MQKTRWHFGLLLVCIGAGVIHGPAHAEQDAARSDHFRPLEAKRVVLCSETLKITMGDIKRFAEAIFPKGEVPVVVSGFEAAPDFEGPTIYAYATGSRTSPPMERCIRNFPQTNHGARAAIESVRAQLLTKPDWYNNVPLGKFLAPMHNTNRYFYGKQWMLMVNASVYTGFEYRKQFLTGLFHLNWSVCEHTRKCDGIR